MIGHNASSRRRDAKPVAVFSSARSHCEISSSHFDLIKSGGDFHRNQWLELQALARNRLSEGTAPGKVVEFHLRAVPHGGSEYFVLSDPHRVHGGWLDRDCSSAFPLRDA